ncbi:MAG: Flp pilus assembly complex ATPase component TadA [Gemmatimonadetes bacterium]|nr:Flp pilus assembly complex ATPase component TadA [Gemmatimonadota bacterium]
MDLGSVVSVSPLLNAAFLEHHGLLPLEQCDGALRVASWHERPDAQAVDDLALLCGARVTLERGDEPSLRAAIQRVYGAGSTAQGVIDAMRGDENGDAPATERALDDLVTQANEAPVVRLVNLLLLEALQARASDVHLEAYAGRLRVRYRVDGVLQEAPSPPPALAAAVTSRLKIIADLDIAERRVPQDGRIRLRLQERPVDVRVSTVPTLHGESIVLRLLDKARGRIELAGLGMSDDVLARFKAAIARPHGIVLATGPTGSGKTTTLYAAVDVLRTGREKILTVEDPVEYELAGVPQVPVHEKAGVTFASALRALLRQDPDVMLVGEIRDGETAAIATQAALTGHLVLSTLHTNDAAGALTRLRELGVEPYLVASTVEAVLAQRLVRVVCRACAEQVAPGDAALAALGATRGELPLVTRGRGCDECRGSGYHGRVGIYELLVMDEPLRKALLAGADATALRALALAGGMRSLRDDGRRLVALGVTTPEEVERVASA